VGRLSGCTSGGLAGSAAACAAACAVEWVQNKICELIGHYWPALWLKGVV